MCVVIEFDAVFSHVPTELLPWIGREPVEANTVFPRVPTISTVIAATGKNFGTLRSYTGG